MRKSSSMDLQYLTKAVRGNMRELGPVCSVESHEDLLRDILEKTPRLNKEEATKAVKKAFPGAEANIQAAFAASMASASTSASSSKPSLPLVKDVETNSGEDKNKRLLKKQDSVVSVSSAPSVASDIQSPPKTKVADLYQNKDKPSFLFYTDMGKRTVVRMSSNGTKEPAVRLRPGAAGFLVAIYEDGMEHESELPNSVGKEPSQPVVKAGSKKRPAAAVEETAVEPVPSVVPAASVETMPTAVATAAVAASGDSEQCEYKLEYRSSTNSVAIRKVVKVECGPPKKRQVVEIIGASGGSGGAGGGSDPPYPWRKPEVMDNLPPPPSEPEEEEDESDLANFSRRTCQKCGKMEYLRKGASGGSGGAGGGSDPPYPWRKPEVMDNLPPPPSEPEEEEDDLANFSRRKRVERGQKYGYSNTQRVGGAGLAADASGQGFSKAAAAAPPEPAVPAAEPVVPPAVPAVGTRDPIDVDYVPPAAESNVPRGVLQIAKREAHGNVTNTPFMRPYAVQPASGFRMHPENAAANLLNAAMMRTASLHVGSMQWMMGPQPMVHAESFQAAMVVPGMVPGPAAVQYANLLAAMMGAPAGSNVGAPGSNVAAPPSAATESTEPKPKEKAKAKNKAKAKATAKSSAKAKAKAKGKAKAKAKLAMKSAMKK
eukprot:symbB.v1.2.011357.t1/scaffold741.1/size166877/1